MGNNVTLQGPDGLAFNRMVQDRSLGLRGVGHALITVPRGEEHKIRLQGLTPNVLGEGAKGVRALRKVEQSMHPERVLTHLARVRDQFGSLDDVVVIEGYRGNAYVNQGLQGMLDSGFGDLVADRITHIGLSADDQAVTATTTSIDPAGGATGVSIKTTDNVSRTAETVSGDQTWTQADVSFAIKKIGYLRGSAATDVSNIIGGSGGSSPYDEPFTIDLTNIATWTLTMGIDVTATAS